MTEAVNHPSHYNSHPSGVECIEVSEFLTPNTAQAYQYTFRAGLKGEALVDLRKAYWFILREISRRLRGVEAQQSRWEDAEQTKLARRVHDAEPDNQKAHALLMIYFSAWGLYHLICALEALEALLKREEGPIERQARADIMDLTRQHHLVPCARDSRNGAKVWRRVKDERVECRLERGGLDPVADLAALKAWAETLKK